MGTIITAVITSVMVSSISGIITYLIQERKIQVEKERLIVQFALEREKIEEQYKTERRADAALSKFLNHVKFKRRSFEYLSEKMGGFEDDELRRMLVRNGALRTIGDQKKEWWELLEDFRAEPEKDTITTKSSFINRLSNFNS